MNFVSKYDIGHRYWVARCIKRVHEEEMELDGKIWVRTYFTFEPLIKQKEITSIAIRVHKSGKSITYGTLNIGEHYSELQRWFPENNIENYTKEEAMAIAKEYAENCEEHFGIDEDE
jgi:hypothetical protein